jgi:UDP-N-acetylglucosamine:LPS N-acetylglucosamine transferase
MLTAQLRRECPDVEAVTVDGLAVMGGAIKAISEDAPRFAFFRAQWLWDLGFWLFASFAPTRFLARTSLGLLGGNPLVRVIEAEQPDVIVSTFPQTTDVLGRLRRQERVAAPVCSAITDLAGMHYWAAPGVDLHLVTHPESIPEVFEVAGRSTRVVCVQGFTDPAFLSPRSARAAREVLRLPTEGRIVIVSGGGWGVGDLIGAVETALSSGVADCVACLCGRNDQLRMTLLARYGGHRRVRIEGFTEQMPEWLAAADVLIHSTAGLTVLEALMRGCPVISYGWGRGHIRGNNEAFVRYGLALVASDRSELETALKNVVLNARAPDLTFAALPSAASQVLSLAARSRQEPGVAA